MGGLQRYLLCASAALFLASTASALPRSAAEQARVFADCMGRTAAMMEHAWLLGHDGAAARTQTRLFETLLEATLPDARAEGLTAAQIRHMRIAAKQEQARLLQYGAFHTDARHARFAQAQARRKAAMCHSLVLG